MQYDETMPMCEIAFYGVRSGKEAVVRLWEPTLDHKTGRCFCFTEILGLPNGEKSKITSDEKFFVLTLAFVRFSQIFAAQEEEFRSRRGSLPQSYFPKEIPWVYGLDVYNRLCAMVDAEVQKIEGDLTRRREADPDWNKGD